MRRALSKVPALLVLVAALLVADVLYQEHGSRVLAEYRSARVTKELRRSWTNPGAVTSPSRLAPTAARPVPTRRVRAAEGFAILYVPRLRSTAWEVPIFHGTAAKELNVGIGHHVDSALPWQDGNMVLSGHRTSYGRPFAAIEKLRDGDRVIVETLDSWYVYTLVEDAVVRPDALWVKRTVPVPAVADAPRVITLITCTPKGSVSKRWVWWGTLTEVREKSDPPAEIVAARPGR